MRPVAAGALACGAYSVSGEAPSAYAEAMPVPPATTTHPRVVLAICCISLFIVGMDATIVNVALPAVRHGLNASVSQLQWTIDSYTVVLASLLMLSGSTADRIGRVKVFQVGLVLFTIASLACSLAPGIGWLIAFRALQGVGASMLNPVAMSIIRNTFHDPRERAQAIGLWGAVFGLSIALGPVVGGLLVPLSWRAIFLVNIPVGIAAIVLTSRYVPESRAARARGVDLGGQALVVVLLATLVSAIIEEPGRGFGSPLIIALLSAAAAALAALIPYELRQREPLIELRFFASRPFAAATAIAVAGFGAFTGFLFVNTLYLQEARGFSPVHAGLCLLPMAAALMVAGPLSGRIVGRHGGRWPIVGGGLAVAAASLMLTSLSNHTPIAWLLLAYTVFGAGVGAINPPITNSALAGMPASQAGVAAAVASTSRMIGQALGVAIIGAIATAGATHSLRAHLAQSSHAAWWLVAALAMVVVALGVFANTAAARASAVRTATRLVGSGD